MEQQLANLLTQLTAQNQALVQSMSQQQQHNDQMFQSLSSAVTSIQNRNVGVIDVRQVGKPDLLKGNRDVAFRDWPSWSYMFITWFSSQFENGEAILNWARDQSTSGISQPELDAALGNHSTWRDISKVNAQLQVALVSL